MQRYGDDGQAAPPLQPVSMVTSLMDSPAEFQALADKWKLSNKEKLLGNFIAAHRGVASSDSTPLKFYQDLLVTNAERDSVLELTRYSDHMDYFSRLRDWTVPVLPLNGRDLIAAGVPKGARLGALLALVKKRWMDSGYELNREELLEMVDKEKKECVEHELNEQKSKKQRTG